MYILVEMGQKIAHSCISIYRIIVRSVSHKLIFFRTCVFAFILQNIQS